MDKKMFTAFGIALGLSLAATSPVLAGPTGKNATEAKQLLSSFSRLMIFSVFAMPAPKRGSTLLLYQAFYPSKTGKIPRNLQRAVEQKSQHGWMKYTAKPQGMNSLSYY